MPRFLELSDNAEIMLLGSLQLSAAVIVYMTRKSDSTSVNIERIVQKAQKEIS